ncbi:hypothetical protein CSUI_007388, partial [Cystoisospora suis]
WFNEDVCSLLRICRDLHLLISRVRFSSSQKGNGGAELVFLLRVVVPGPSHERSLYSYRRAAVSAVARTA